MNNFLEFINKDIEAKKTLISTMPTKTKTNKKISNPFYFSSLLTINLNI